MKYWDKRTRNEAGEYCRHGDWVVKRIPRQPELFTQIAPPEEAFEGMPVDWNEAENKWDYNLESYEAKKELAKLDSEGELNRTVEEVVAVLDELIGALSTSSTVEEVYSKVQSRISDFGKEKIINRQTKRDKIK